MKLITGLLIFLLLGCASTETIEGPDGTPHELVRCINIKRCYERARDACGGNYEIINTSNNVTGAQMQAMSDINLLVKCWSQGEIKN